MAVIADPAIPLFFSVASIWDAVIKHARGKPDFALDPGRLRRGLLDNGYLELAIGAAHVLAVRDLPAIHRDRFDRLLVARARTEGLRLLTSDAALVRYGKWFELV